MPLARRRSRAMRRGQWGGVPMSKPNGGRPLDTEIAAYQRQAADLEASYLGKWVVFKGATLMAIHESFETAAEDAIGQFGRGPYLIRQIGAPPIVAPASLAYSTEDEIH